jgi:hypothetical protein
MKTLGRKKHFTLILFRKKTKFLKIESGGKIMRLIIAVRQEPGNSY